MGIRDKVLVCECGLVVRSADEDSFVAQVQGHARSVHGLEFSREQVLALRDGRRSRESNTPRSPTEGGSV